MKGQQQAVRVCVLEVEMVLQRFWREDVDEIRECLVMRMSGIFVGKRRRECGDGGRGLAGRMVLRSQIRIEKRAQGVNFPEQILILQTASQSF